MKNSSRILALYFALYFALVLTATGHAGHETGHGGDARAASFVSIAHQLLSDLKQRPVVEIDTVKLERAILEARVRSTTDTLKDIKSGEIVDAINHPKLNHSSKTPPEIVINQSAWDSIAEGFEKRRLVLHEYLNLCGLDDGRYQLSSQIDRARVCSRSAAMRAALERAFGGAACDKISIEELGKLRSIEFRADEAIEKIVPSDLASLKLGKMNVIVPEWRKLDRQVWSGIKRLSTEWNQNALLARAAKKEFKMLEYLELHNVDLLDYMALRELPHLEELILVSDPAQPVTIHAGTFLSMRTSPLRRIVLCDLGETGKSNYVQIPNFVARKDSLLGLEKVEEATLCLNFSGSKNDLLDKKFLSSLRSLAYLWFKTDNWSALDDDFFADTRVGTRIALIPSGRALNPPEFHRFKGLDCQTGWDWSKESVHKFVSGKVYCVRK